MKMPSLFSGSGNNSVLAAADRSLAIVEFTPDGVILDANENFLSVVGYSLGEIKGKHHALFVQPGERDSAAYKDLWAKLERGVYDAGQYRRVTRDGRGIWLQATYNPVLDRRGRCVKVVKFATDITDQKTCMADYDGQLAAIDVAEVHVE